MGSPSKNETGTYTISGTTLTMGDPTTNSGDAYCVENDRLHIIGLDSTTGALVGAFPRYHPRWAWWMTSVPLLREFAVMLRDRKN